MAANFFNTPDITENGFYCQICDATVDTKLIWESHISGKRHIKNMRNQKNAWKRTRTKRFRRHEYVPSDEYIPKHEHVPRDDYSVKHEYVPRDEYVPRKESVPKHEYRPRDAYVPETKILPRDDFMMLGPPKTYCYCENLANANRDDAYKWYRKRKNEVSSKPETQSTKSSYFSALSRKTHHLKTVPTIDVESASFSKSEKAPATIKNPTAPSTARSVIAPPDFGSIAASHSRATPLTSKSSVASPSSFMSTIALKSRSSVGSRSGVIGALNLKSSPVPSSASRVAPSNSGSSAAPPKSKTTALTLDASCTPSSASHLAKEASPPQASSPDDWYMSANSTLSADQISTPKGIEDVDLLRDVHMCSTEMQMELLEFLLVEEPAPLETEEDIKEATEILNQAKQVLLKWQVDRLPLEEQQRFVNAIELQEEDPLYKEVFGPVVKNLLE